MRNTHCMVFAFFLLISFSCARVSKTVVTSPDGKIKVEAGIENGKPFYQIKKGDKTIIEKSFLGFILKGNDPFYKDFSNASSDFKSFSESWTQPWGEEITVDNTYNEMTIHVAEKSGLKRKMSIIFRVFNDGVGFRYEFPEQENLKKFEITAELTEFALPEDHEAWWIPAYNANYYESLYTKSPVSQLDTVCVPLTMETKDGKYITIHEANLTDYAAMNLISNGTTLKTELTPWSTGIKVYAQAPSVTPWRTIIMADDLNQLANSRIMLNLNEPCKIEDTSWLHPAKYIGIWWGMHTQKYTWSQGPKHGATTKNMKEYIDFAVAHHIQGVLVEGWNEGWDGDWVENGNKFNFTKPYPDFDMEEISKYAARKGVEIIGHNETGGSTINYENQLDSAFIFFNKYDIHTVKTGYVNVKLDKKEHHKSQYGVRHYRKVIETAAKYKIMIDNHEPVIPTGLQRTWPNLISQEGVRGAEYDAWSQDGGSPPQHTCILPFTRGLAGPMDFTFGTFCFENPVFPQTRVQSTIAKQLALYVVIYSPLQMASDFPENYSNKPAFKFIEEVPVDWAKTIIKDGKIGDFIVTVRKDKYSDDWYLGAITDENARTVKVDFSFLEKGKVYKAKIYKDAVDSDWKTNPYPVVIEEQEITSESVLDLYLAPGGGTAIRIQS